MNDERQAPATPHNPPARPAPPRPPAAAHSGIRWGRWIVTLLILAGAAVAADRFYIRPAEQKKKSAASQPIRPIPVVADKARRGDLPIYLDGLGTVTALNTVIIRSRVDGELINVAFTEGQLVHKGDLLVEIDPRPYQVQLEQAQGQLARDEASLRNAQLDLNRYESVEPGAVTQQQRDAAVAAVAQLQGAIKTDQGQIDAAKLLITYCRITSPLTGRIGLRMVDQGNMVHAADPSGMAVVTQLQPISVVFNLPEENLPAIMAARRKTKELRVEAYNSDFSSRIAVGVLMAIDNQIDLTSGTARFKAQFENEDESLYPNQFVNIRLLVDTKQAAVLVPSAAVQRSPDTAFVYVVKPDQTVEMRPVTPGPSEADTTLIEKGVEPGQTVVTDGVDKLQPGSKVAIHWAGAASSAPSSNESPRSIRNHTAPSSAPAATHNAPARSNRAHRGRS